MKIIEETPVIITHGIGTEESFKIGNLGRILKILRDSMYSNPIKAIVREVTCNARDAHREIGTPDFPIEIMIPSKLNSYLRIKDFGPGISPDRMSNVFINYGTSTKNNDNDQTGGFGLGAKTPFAYSDQFQIVSISQGNDGKNYKRTYIAFIDSSEEGKMRLVSEIETDEHTGCEISLSIKDNDIYAFEEAVFNVCRFWKVKPKVLGSNRSWEPVPESVLDFLDVDAYICQLNTYSAKSYAVIDGISYELKTSVIKTNDNDSIQYYHNSFDPIFNNSFIFNIGIGEVTLSANREELQYDERTIKYFLDKVEKIKEKINENVSEKIQDSKTLQEAINQFYKLKSMIDHCDIRKMSWKGQKLFNKLNFSDKLRLKYKVASINSYSSSYKPYIIDSIGEFIFNQNHNDIEVTKIYWNDLSNTHPISRLRYKYDNGISRSKSEDALCITPLTKGQTKDEFIKDFTNDTGIDWSLFEILDVSTALEEPPKIEKESRKSNIGKFSIFEFDLEYKTVRNTDHYWRPIKAKLADIEGYYFLLDGTSGNNKTFKYDGETLTLFKDPSGRFYQYGKFKKTFKDKNIYAIRKKHLDKIGPKLKPFSDLLDKTFDKIEKEKGISKQEIYDYGKIDFEDFARIMNSQDPGIDNYIDEFKALCDKIRICQSENSILAHYIPIKPIKSTKYSLLLQFLKDRYPLLALSPISYHSVISYKNHVTEYIKLINDKHKNDQALKVLDSESSNDKHIEEKAS